MSFGLNNLENLGWTICIKKCFKIIDDLFCLWLMIKIIYALEHRFIITREDKYPALGLV